MCETATHIRVFIRRLFFFAVAATSALSACAEGDIPGAVDAENEKRNDFGKEIKRVQPMVDELMSSYVEKYNARKTAAEAVANAAAAFVRDAEMDASKYLLLKVAIKYYAVAGEYDLAADALETLRAAVADVPDEEIALLAENALNNAKRNEGARLRAIRAAHAVRAARREREEHGRRENVACGERFVRKGLHQTRGVRQIHAHHRLDEKGRGRTYSPKPQHGLVPQKSGCHKMLCGKRRGNQPENRRAKEHEIRYKGPEVQQELGGEHQA